MRHTIVRYSPAVITFILALAAGGCAFMRYRGPEGESFSRLALGTSTAVSSLAIQTLTNGTRAIELRGLNSDSAAAMGAVTEAAVRAALTNAR